MLQSQSGLYDLDLDFCTAPWRPGLLSTTISNGSFLQVKNFRIFVYRKDLHFTNATFRRAISRLSPKSYQELMEVIKLGNYFTFTIVRHPLDRLISAYRDRILNGCTDQAKLHIPAIFHLTRSNLLTLGTSVLYDKITNCIDMFPTFEEFIRYVIVNPDGDLHWMPYHQHCSPCQIEYDEIIKLETAVQDEEYVLKQSMMDQYLNLSYHHYRQSNDVQTEDLRSKYFSNLICFQFDELTKLYSIDFRLFAYDVNEFRQYCIQT